MPDVAQLTEAGPDLGRSSLGRLRQLLVPPRLHAGPESGRSVGHERLRSLDVRALVLAAGDAAVRAHRQPVLQHGPKCGSALLSSLGGALQPGQPEHLAVPDRPVLRAGVHTGHAQHLHRDGTVQRHAAGERDRLSHAHGAAEVLPPACPERGQRPFLELVAVCGRSGQSGGPGNRSH